MFTFQRSYVKKDYQWSELDVSAVSIEDIKNTYQNIRVVTTYDADPALRVIDLKDNINLFGSIEQSKTITEWLAQLTDTGNIIYSDDKVDFNSVQCVRHMNAYELPITLKYGNMNYGEGVPIPTGLSKDLVISSSASEVSEMSVANIVKNMLVAINGKVCFSQFYGERGFVVDAAKHMTNAKGSVVSFIDFTDVGGLTKVNLDEDNVRVIDETANDIKYMRRRAVVTVDEVPSGTTPIFILDGHMHILDGTYKRNGANSYVLTLNMEAIIKRVAKNKVGNVDFVASANLRGYGVDGSTFDVAKYISQTDSFIAFVHTEDLCIFKERMKDTGIYGEYEHYRCPRGLVVNELGEYMPHKVVESSSTQLAISVGHNVRENLFTSNKAFDPKAKFSGKGFKLKRHSNKGKYYRAYAFELYTF